MIEMVIGFVWSINDVLRDLMVEMFIGFFWSIPDGSTVPSEQFCFIVQ